MGSLRFGFTNHVQGATLKNGSGGGAPALDEVSPWVMTMAQNRDRGMPWQASAAGFIDVDFDLGSNKSVGLLAVLGHRSAPSGAIGATACDVLTQTGAYTPGGVWTSRGVITLGSGVRDGGYEIAPVTARSVRFSFTAAQAFTIGRLFAGTVEQDFDCVSSPGYARKPITQRIENRMADGSPFFTIFGEERWEYSLPYEDIDETLFDKVLAVARQSRTFVMLDRDDTAFEAFVPQASFQHALKHDLPDVHDAQLLIETLP